MSTLSDPLSAQFFVAALTGRAGAWPAARERIEHAFGAVVGESGPLPAHHFRFYADETGPDLEWRIVAVGEPRTPGDLPQAKIDAARIERETSRESGRSANLDPGYVSLDHVVVATGKSAAGRPYLDRGVYAYVALVFHAGRFEPLPHTYPSYREPATIEFFHGIRNDLKSRGLTPAAKERR